MIERLRNLFSIAGLLLILFIFVSTASAQGDKIFAEKKCVECHAIQGPSKITTIDERLKKKGPDLWFAGSKFNKEWLIEWLERGTQIRSIKYNTLSPEPNSEKHPMLPLPEKEAHAVAEYLVTLVDKEIKEGSVKPGSGNDKKVKKAFEKDFACYSCHKMKAGDEAIGGVSGPTFLDAGKRLKADWINAYLLNPDRYEPKGRSPKFNHIATPEILSGLADYVASFK